MAWTPKRSAWPRSPVSSSPGSKEVVHASDARHRVVHAGRDAGAKQRGHAVAGVAADPLFALDGMERDGSRFAAPHCRAPNTASIFFLSSGTDTGFFR